MNWKNTKYSLIFILTAEFLFSQSNEEIFNQANKFYKDGNFEQARNNYELLISKGIENEVLFYNAGNTYFRLNKIGLAILYYEKALKLSPLDKDIIANLKYANLQKIDKDVQTEFNPFTKFILFVYNLFSVNSSIAFASLSYFLLIGLIILLLYSNKILIKKNFLYYGIYIIAPIFIIMTILSAIKISNNKNLVYGIILAPQVEVKSGPGEDYTISFPLHEGSKIRIKQSQENYYLILLPNGYNGWVKKETVGII